jgi:hypothetical protein
LKLWEFSPHIVGIFAVAVILEFFRRHRWNFAIAVVGILPLPSLEFCRCRRWNFAVAVIGILPSASWNLPHRH